ncbi:hypothetical protein Cgig2_022348 [Carnegiea gigantea]|uniref:DUF4283 domain-containing protein n=1 Tax=Carnegiea gigantea TaxID=171969 RepID=A0A9Q1KGE0_9CARY|nr:hypothetical protein Cgig2_022348 [Carnegiea gigantea]
MASDLEDGLNSLKLTEAEEEILDFEDPGIERVDEQIALCLVGRLLTDSHFNLDALKTTMKNIWRPATGVIFFPHADKEVVLNEGPWAFNGSLLILKQLKGDEKPSEVGFSAVRFWVKVCDLPMRRKTYAFAKFLGHKKDILTPSKYLKLLVDVDITKPLWRGMQINIEGKPKWVELRYIKLSDYYYACGLIEYVSRGCDRYVDGTAEVEFPYGLKIKRKRRGDKLKQILVDSVQVVDKKGVRESTALEDMVVEGGTEMVKWKIIDMVGGKVGEWKVRLLNEPKQSETEGVETVVERCRRAQ